MKLNLVTADAGEKLEQIKALYKTAFPSQERKPFSLLLEKKREGRVEIFSAEDDDGKLAGEAIIFRYGDLVLLAYFAIAESFRGKGIGTDLLEQLLIRYKGCRFVLEIESTKIPAADRQQRQRRKDFYVRSGLDAMSFSVLYYGVELEILTYECDVTFQEYYEVYERIFGPDATQNIWLASL